MALPDLLALLPERVRAGIEPLLRGGARNLMLAGAALAVAAVVIGFLWSWNSSYAVLYAGLSAEEGGRAIGDLQKLNIPYRTAEGGRVILVPSGDLGRARLELALRGVPKRSGDQWALLDNESLGVSPFVERVHYDRAVESALSQTIAQIDGVVSANVKLALPKDTDFLGTSPKPSASVMVRLAPGVRLAPTQVDGIAGLVAGSVPGLARERVTIVDQDGKVLTQNGGGLEAVSQQLGITRDVEQRYERAVAELLAPVLGQGNFRVAVDADIDFSHVKESTIRYGTGHVLSEDETVHPAGSSGAAPIGIPGALSNRPPPPIVAANPPSAAAGGGGAGVESGGKPAKPAPAQPDTHRTTNYDIDHTVEYLEHPSWTLRAVNVAVLVNHPSGKPLADPMIRSIKTLAASVIGAGENRHVAVVDLPFDGMEASAGGGPLAWWSRPWVAAVGENGLLAIGGLAMLFGGLRPLLRRLDSGPPMRRSGERTGIPVAAGRPAVPVGRQPRVVAGTAFRPPAIDADPETVRNLVISEPDRTTQVIKEWIARDRNRLRNAG